MCVPVVDAWSMIQMDIWSSDHNAGKVAFLANFAFACASEFMMVLTNAFTSFLSYLLM